MVSRVAGGGFEAEFDTPIEGIGHDEVAIGTAFFIYSWFLLPTKMHLFGCLLCF